MLKAYTLSAGRRMVLISLFIACSPNSNDEPSENNVVPTVQTLSFPVHFLVERIGAEIVKSECVLPVGEDPASWNPSPEIISKLQDSDLVFSNGVDFEAWTKTASLPTSKMIYTADKLDLIEKEGKTHSHGKGGDHSHGELDSHTWIDPLLYSQQAEQVHKALLRIRPDRKEQLDKNYEQLKENLASLAGEYKIVFDSFREVKLSANHPSFSYLARRYEIDLHNFGRHRIG